MGRDLAWACLTLTCCLFQSTRPHGARLSALTEKQSTYYVSIHAPAWGATVGAEMGEYPPEVSIHAPAWGATVSPSILTALTPSFNPRARMGRDQGGRFISTYQRSFNPRARMGRDTPGVPGLIGVQPVSIHAPACGATVVYSTEKPDV